MLFANTQIAHTNPDCDRPLIIPVHLLCNTDDDALYSNIRTNTHYIPTNWVKREEAHEGIAILCGSGPSISDQLDKIKELKEQGGTVFALNGCAKYLNDNGIFPDYQVMIDAREETSQLVGPAKEHLFASQVHPKCFEKAPNARLWHLQIENIEDHFPSYEGSYVLIGGAASVGNTATCLAFALGFRRLECFGYDSSSKGMNDSHAFPQPMNNGEPMAWVEWNGKSYLSSLTMKMQAEKFQQTAKDLTDLGCKITVHGYGLLPDIWNTPPLSEKEKYQAIWNHSQYRDISPGEMSANVFCEVVKPEDGKRIVDYGCGTGRGSVALRNMTKCEIVQVDFAENSRDEDARDFLFYEADLSQKLPVFGDYGYCTDVMEHIPPDLVKSVISNIMESSPKVFFQISVIEDNLGILIGQKLHLTVMPHKDWKMVFESLGLNIEFEREGEIFSMFYVTKQ